MTSALVSVLLNHGFQMFFSGSYSDILQLALPVRNTGTCTVADEGAIHLLIERLRASAH